MRQLSKQYALSPRVFSPVVLEACQAHSWPGNLREMENFVKRYLAGGRERVAVRERLGSQSRIQITRTLSATSRSERRLRRETILRVRTL